MKPAIHIQTTGKAVIGLLLILSGFTLWGQPGELPKFKDHTSEEDLSTAKATMKAYESGNWEDLRSFLAEDAIVYGLGNFDSLTVDETISYWSAGRKDAAPILADNGTWLDISLEEGPRKGHWVYHWGNNTISSDNGEIVTFPYHIALKMENHKIKEAHFYYDNMKIIRAMGFALSPPIEEDQDDEVVGIVEQP